MYRNFSSTNEVIPGETETKVDLGISQTGTTTVSKRHVAIISNRSVNDAKKLDCKGSTIVSTSEVSDEDNDEDEQYTYI